MKTRYMWIPSLAGSPNARVGQFTRGQRRSHLQSPHVRVPIADTCHSFFGNLLKNQNKLSSVFFLDGSFLHHACCGGFQGCTTDTQDPGMGVKSCLGTLAAKIQMTRSTQQKSGSTSCWCCCDSLPPWSMTKESRKGCEAVCS